MTEKQNDFIVELTAGAILLVLGAFVLTTDWPNWTKGLVVAGAVVVAVAAVLVMAPVGRKAQSWWQHRSKPVAPSPPPTLAQRIDATWFISFTSGPYVCGDPPRDQYVTAIAAVGQVEGALVELIWRDKGSFPAKVPVKLLEATDAYRYRSDADGQRRVRVRNEGLHSPAPGGVVAGSGWHAHRHSPHQIAFARFDDLTSEDRKAMEADADLATYDLDAL